MIHSLMKDNVLMIKIINIHNQIDIKSNLIKLAQLYLTQWLHESLEPWIIELKWHRHEGQCVDVGIFQNNKQNYYILKPFNLTYINTSF